jgi:hypothetical protein
MSCLRGCPGDARFETRVGSPGRTRTYNPSVNRWPRSSGTDRSLRAFLGSRCRLTFVASPLLESWKRGHRQVSPSFVRSSGVVALRWFETSATPSTTANYFSVYSPRRKNSPAHDHQAAAKLTDADHPSRLPFSPSRSARHRSRLASRTRPGAVHEPPGWARAGRS